MAERYSHQTRHSLSYDSGFTVMELMVASFIALSVLAMSLSTVKLMRYLSGQDAVRAKLNDTLRGAMEIIATDVRTAGENLPPTMPAVEVAHGSSSDTLTVRRNLLDEAMVLNVCQQVNTGTSSNVVFANSPTTPGCIYTASAFLYNGFRSYRQQNGNAVQAFIYDSVAKTGEFFNYTGESDTGSAYSVNRGSGTWAHTYPVTTSWVYIIEEWKYQFSNGSLQVIQNRDNANALTVGLGLTAFNSQINMQDGSILQTFTPSDSWISIANIQVTLSASDHYAKHNINRTLVGKFFPRNILSN